MTEDDMREFVNGAREASLNTPQLIAMRDQLGAAITEDMGELTVDGIKGATAATMVLLAGFEDPQQAPYLYKVMTVLVAGHLADLWDTREASA